MQNKPTLPWGIACCCCLSSSMKWWLGHHHEPLTPAYTSAQCPLISVNTFRHPTSKIEKTRQNKALISSKRIDVTGFFMVSSQKVGETRCETSGKHHHQLPTVDPSAHHQVAANDNDALCSPTASLPRCYRPKSGPHASESTQIVFFCG